MDKIEKIFTYLMGLMGGIIKTLIALAVFGVLFGIVRYFWYDSPDKRKEANKFIIYGLLSLFVMTGVWGLVYLFGNFFGVEIGGGPKSGGSADTTSGSNLPIFADPADYNIVEQGGDSNFIITNFEGDPNTKNLSETNNSGINPITGPTEAEPNTSDLSKDNNSSINPDDGPSEAGDYNTVKLEDVAGTTSF